MHCRCGRCAVRWQHWTVRAFFTAQGQPSEYQAVGQDIGVALGASEDESLLEVALAEQVIEQGVAVRAIVGPVQALLDLGMRFRG